MRAPSPSRSLRAERAYAEQEAEMPYAEQADHAGAADGAGGAVDAATRLAIGEARRIQTNLSRAQRSLARAAELAEEQARRA